MAVFSELEKEVILNEVREKYQCRTEKEFKQYVEIITGFPSSTKEQSTVDTAVIYITNC